MIQPSNPTRQELLDRLQRVLEEERDVVQLLREDSVSNAASLGSLAKDRRDVWQELRGSVKHYGDILAPIDVEWDAAK